VAAYLAISGMYVVALSTLFRLPQRPRPVGASSTAVDTRTQLLEGLRYVRSSPTILTLIGMNLIVVAFGMPYQTLMPVFAERVYEAGASGLGLLLAASGVGALAGAVAVAGVGSLKRPALVQLGLAVGLGAALVAFALTRWFPLALGLMVVVGFLFAAFSALNNTLLMSNTEARLTGRVMSIYLLTWAVMPVGALPLAWLAEQAGAPLAIGVAGVIVIVGVLILARLNTSAERISWGS
jgi:predicted MFS family arabinose efflux permease